MNPWNSSILVAVLVMAALFGLLFISQSMQLISPNKPKVVNFVSDSNLSSYCVSIKHYESLFDRAPMLVPPSYLPQGYSLQCINVSGPKVSEENAVSFYYFKDDQEFQSSFLPKIEKETADHPMYAKWFPEFYNAGGIVITRSIEHIEEDDPRYNDKVKHIEIDRAIGNPQNNCSLPELSKGNCEMQGTYPPIKFANENPIDPTFVNHGGKRLDGMLMFMDYNWLVYIIGPSDPDELFKIAESIHQIEKT